MKLSFSQRLLVGTFKGVNSFVAWHRLPKWIAVINLLVGCLCEPLPKGFGFSDTAFRVFILMASRRLKSDRFLSSDFKPETYTKPGMDWVQNTNMKDVLIRHFPELRAPLRNVKNAFAPWEKVGG